MGNDKMLKEELQKVANKINRKVELYLDKKRMGEGEDMQIDNLITSVGTDNVTFETALLKGLIEIDGEVITERFVADVILNEVKALKEVLHAVEFKLFEDDDLGIYRIGHPVINLDGYWVEFDAKEEYAEVRYNYNNRIEGTTVKEMEDFDFECAYNYDKVSRITTPNGLTFLVDSEGNLV